MREGRRITGRYTLTVHDIFTDREKTDAIALGSYDVDTKLSQVVFTEGILYRDLGMHEPAPVYEIPYTAMVPARGGITNLLAPVGVSSSPTAYGSLRVEPQYMALGQAAGVAAALATTSGEGVAALPAKRVQRALYTDGVSFRASDVCRDTPLGWRAAGGYTGDCRVVPVEPG